MHLLESLEYAVSGLFQYFSYACIPRYEHKIAFREELMEYLGVEPSDGGIFIRDDGYFFIGLP